MRRFGLRGKLTLVLLALALVPLAVTTAVLVRLNLHRLATSAKEFRIAVASDAVRAIRGVLEQARIEQSAAGAALADPSGTMEDRVRATRARLVASSLIDQMALYDRDGAHVDTFRAHDAPGPPRPEALPVPLMERALADGVAHGEVEMHGSPARPFLAIVQPVHRGEPPVLWGFAWSPLDLRRLSADLSQASARRFTGRTDRVFAVDDRLRFVAHGDPARLMQAAADRGMLASFREDPSLLHRVDADYAADYAVEGNRVLGVLIPIPELGWGVVVEQDEAEAYHAVRTTWQTALGVGIAAAVLAALLGLLAGRRLSFPIVSMARAARRVAGGDFAVRVEARRRDEVGDLAASFNTMATDLVGYRDRLVEETRIRTNLTRYLSPEVVDNVVAQHKDLELGGQRREVTVLFADLAGFTPLAERNPPERVVAVLNELFTFLTEIVFRHEGMVDKFVGDCVMAVFGLPDGRPDDALRAVAAAEEMMRWMETGNARWRRELGTELKLAVGINTGPVLAGNIGSRKRMEYTVIGDVVNVAARLETLARPGQVLMTAATASRVLDEMPCTHVVTHRFPDKQEDTEIWALSE